MKNGLIIVALTFVSAFSFAAEKDWGRVSASLESNNHIYIEDKANGFSPSDLLQLSDDNIFAENDYLKVDYYKNRLSAGMQLEGYFPSTVGYPFPINRLSLSNLYVSWKDSNYSVTAGTFYDQLGSGLLFRSWEDRTLGLNNALLGARATYSFGGKVDLKAFWGIPRLDKWSESALMQGKKGSFFGLGLADKVNITGADVSVSLSDIIGWSGPSLSVEGSLVNKHESHEAMNPAVKLNGMPENNLSWSARANFEAEGFYTKLEYVGVGKQAFDFKVYDANAQLIELGYNSRGLGVSFTGRRLQRMTQQIYTSNLSYASAANVMSYCPAMTTQYTYMLTTLNPYNPETGGLYKRRAGEIGGQLDAFYNFRRGTKIGGKRGMKVHANFSTYYSLNETGGTEGSEFLFRDFSLDVERQWTKKFKTTLMYSLQDYNKEAKNSAGYEVYVGLSHIFVADLLYKWTQTFSTRLELQYLASKDYQKDWMAALLEVSFAPHWSVFASDMYNHGDTGLHYYNAGVSFAFQNMRIAAGYGRYRAGFICSGGVCREIPAYTGANLTLTASF